MAAPIQGIPSRPARRRLRRGFAAPASPASATVAPASEAGRDEAGVGRRLWQLRAERGLSIRALAEASGLSVNTLSLIENGRTSPSVGTLQQVARALGVSITAFFESEAPGLRAVFIKAARRPQARFAHGLLSDLGTGMAERCVQPFLITLEPNSGSGPQPIVHTGCEFVYCLAGRITYTVDGQTHLLEPGDSLLFESHLPHQWHNVDAEPSQALLVLCPADDRDRPTDRHFSLADVVATAQ
jgi:transcriptional regulator with XRE-family HTH domain